MKCNECGVDTPSGAKFCGECGSGLTAVANPSPQQTLPVPMSAEEGQGAWAALSAHQRQAVLIVVAGLLITIGFLASFGFSNKTWYGSESLSGTQFAEAGERAWGNEGDPYETGGPLLELSYLLPVAGLTLLFLGYQRYQGPSDNGGRWITGVSATALVALIVSWAMYFQAFGTYESRPGIGSFLCALGAVLGMWQGHKSWQESAQHPTQAAESGLYGSLKLPRFAALQGIAMPFAVTVIAGAIMTPIYYSVMEGGSVGASDVSWVLTQAISSALLGVCFFVSRTAEWPTRAKWAIGSAALAWTLDLVAVVTQSELDPARSGQYLMLLLVFYFAAVITGAASTRQVTGSDTGVDVRLMAALSALTIVLGVGLAVFWNGVVYELSPAFIIHRLIREWGPGLVLGGWLSVMGPAIAPEPLEVPTV